MLEKICWNIFSNTGDINTYLFYRMLKEIDSETLKKSVKGKQVSLR